LRVDIPDMFTKHKLKNGIRFITAPMTSTKTVTVLAVIGAGSKYENKKNNGISHFLEHMFFKGTKKRPTSQDIAGELDKVGGEYNAFTGQEYTGYYAKVDASHLDLALDVISDMLINSKFDAQEIEKEKGVIIEEINMYRDTPRRYVGELFEKLLYGDQPAGWHIAGEKENILKFKRPDFSDYLKNHYTASNMAIAVAGNFNKDLLDKKINSYFGKITNGKAKGKEKVREKQDNPESLLHYKKTDQTHFCLGVRTYDMFHSSKFAQEISAIILGGNMSSRLFTEVREKRGLAYYVYTDTGKYTDSGYLVSQAGVDNKRVNEAIEVIVAEYKKIKKDGISETELVKAKDYIKGKMALNLESSDEVAGFLADQEILKNKIELPEEILRQINKVTINEVNNLAKDIFQLQKLNLALIGPFKDKKRFEKLLVL